MIVNYAKENYAYHLTTDNCQHFSVRVYNAVTGEDAVNCVIRKGKIQKLVQSLSEFEADLNALSY